jgi:hypothetical protein
MSKKPTIEDLLMRFRNDPSAHVKRAVLARYAERYGRGRHGATGATRLWRKPVPLYVAAALVVVAAGLSFVGGQRFSRPERIAGSAPIAAQDSLVREALDQSWHYAPRDVL